jgi:hypothetical protein
MCPSHGSTGYCIAPGGMPLALCTLQSQSSALYSTCVKSAECSARCCNRIAVCDIIPEMIRKAMQFVKIFPLFRIVLVHQDTVLVLGRRGTDAAAGARGHRSFWEVGHKYASPPACLPLGLPAWMDGWMDGRTDHLSAFAGRWHPSSSCTSSFPSSCCQRWSRCY